MQSVEAPAHNALPQPSRSIREENKSMVDSNDSFMRELKEEIEREKLENIWKKYGTLIVGAALALVIAVGAWQIWQAMAKRSAEQAGVAYQDALDKVLGQDLDAAEQGFSKLASSGPAGYAPLAQLQLAGTYLEQNKPKEALATFEALAKDSGVDQLLSDYARVQAAALRLGDADYSEMQNRLGGLINDQNSWRFNARELLGLSAWKAGKTEEARKMFGEIAADENASPALRQRAELRLTQISAGGSLPDFKVAPKPAADAGAGAAAAPAAAQADPVSGGDAKADEAAGQSEETKAEDAASTGSAVPSDAN